MSLLKPTNDEIEALARAETRPASYPRFRPLSWGLVGTVLALGLVGLISVPWVLGRIFLRWLTGRGATRG